MQGEVHGRKDVERGKNVVEEWRGRGIQGEGEEREDTLYTGRVERGDNVEKSGEKEVCRGRGRKDYAEEGWREGIMK
jgi:hypothetical protein